MWPFRKKVKAQQSLPVMPGVVPGEVPGEVPGALRARYDAAQTTVDNARHWANADGLSADAAASADVRGKLRNRARYEVANNAYAKGIVLTLANDCVGTGPRLQLLTEDAEINRIVETAFANWAREIHLAEKIRTMRMAKATDGEAFALIAGNPRIDSPVKIDLQLIEADRITTPTPAPGDSPALGNRSSGRHRAFDTRDETLAEVDGIEFDRHGNPRTYLVHRQHPGQTAYTSIVDVYDRVPAASMIHWFRPDRPGQHRGVPEITPALPLFAQLRRYTLAVLAAAETAADFAAVLYTDAPANGEASAVEPMDVVQLEKRMATTLPDGWKLGQIKAEQPGTTYSEFKHELLNEIARCLNMPFNVAAGNSAGYNYASGRLDYQTYFKSIRVEQADCSNTVLDRIFAAWLHEASLLRDFAFLRGIDARARRLARQWFWDGTEHVDPAKEATAQAKRLSSNTTTLAAEYARQGKDWETELRQRAKEKQLMKQLGLSEAQTQPEQPPRDNEEDTDAPGSTPGNENPRNQRQAA
ncbi:phage portal protein [Mucisphaera calidilacus]|uniref:Phage portal protein, lambda family n=1 Tax=Mucisphaera calidilacus TaxID=2527982 RepID=A0A518BVR7_9BACT|nr:phage portal protein [Mucisphaera calidilacus]QDU71047.1 Phage portal protein, lambda family [Mucisphaera calidilacus]